MKTIWPIAEPFAGGCDIGHSLLFAALLRAPLMNRWTSLLGAMMLVLMLWTGGAAHAAERFDCIPVTAESVEHFDGDQDQVPSSPDQGVAHHHSGCNGHHLAGLDNLATIDISGSGQAMPLAWREAGVPSHSPDADLRPPIA